MRLIGIAQLTKDKNDLHSPDHNHLYSFYEKKGDSKLYIRNLDMSKAYRSGWERFSDLPKSPSYQGFKLEFIYE